MEYELQQVDQEYGGIHMNSGPDLAALIEAGMKLGKEFPGTHYAVVDREGAAIWASSEERRYVLVRILGEIDQLLAPGTDPVAVMKIGAAIATEHPDWTLAVRDGERRIIWATQKNALGKAEDAHKNG